MYSPYLDFTNNKTNSTLNKNSKFIDLKNDLRNKDLNNIQTDNIFLENIFNNTDHNKYLPVSSSYYYNTSKRNTDELLKMTNYRVPDKGMQYRFKDVTISSKKYLNHSTVGTNSKASIHNGNSKQSSDGIISEGKEYEQSLYSPSLQMFDENDISSWRDVSKDLTVSMKKFCELDISKNRDIFLQHLKEVNKKVEKINHKTISKKLEFAEKEEKLIKKKGGKKYSLGQKLNYQHKNKDQVYSFNSINKETQYLEEKNLNLEHNTENYILKTKMTTESNLPIEESNSPISNKESYNYSEKFMSKKNTVSLCAKTETPNNKFSNTISFETKEENLQSFGDKQLQSFADKHECHIEFPEEDDIMDNLTINGAESPTKIDSQSCSLKKFKSIKKIELTRVNLINVKSSVSMIQKNWRKYRYSDAYFIRTNLQDSQYEKELKQQEKIFIKVHDEKINCNEPYKVYIFKNRYTDHPYFTILGKHLKNKNFFQYKVDTNANNQIIPVFQKSWIENDKDQNIGNTIPKSYEEPIDISLFQSVYKSLQTDNKMKYLFQKNDLDHKIRVNTACFDEKSNSPDNKINNETTNLKQLSTFVQSQQISGFMKSDLGLLQRIEEEDHQNSVASSKHSIILTKENSSKRHRKNKPFKEVSFNKKGKNDDIENNIVEKSNNGFKNLSEVIENNLGVYKEDDKKSESNRSFFDLLNAKVDNNLDFVTQRVENMHLKQDTQFSPYHAIINRSDLPLEGNPFIEGLESSVSNNETPFMALRKAPTLVSENLVNSPFIDGHQSISNKFMSMKHQPILDPESFKKEESNSLKFDADKFKKNKEIARKSFAKIFNRHSIFKFEELFLKKMKLRKKEYYVIVIKSGDDPNYNIFVCAYNVLAEEVYFQILKVSDFSSKMYLKNTSNKKTWRKLLNELYFDTKCKQIKWRASQNRSLTNADNVSYKTIDPDHSDSDNVFIQLNSIPHISSTSCSRPVTPKIFSETPKVSFAPQDNYESTIKHYMEHNAQHADKVENFTQLAKLNSVYDVVSGSYSQEAKQNSHRGSTFTQWAKKTEGIKRSFISNKNSIRELNSSSNNDKKETDSSTFKKTIRSSSNNDKANNRVILNYRCDDDDLFGKVKPTQINSVILGRNQNDDKFFSKKL